LDFILISVLLYLVNIVLSILVAIIIIKQLYVSKKFSKEDDFHFYNDLFSWETFFIMIAAENFLKILQVLLLMNIIVYDFMLRIRILILFFPFWTKIFHLEKVMDKITYERHYFGGIIPLILVFVLFITNLPTMILILIFLGTTFIPYLLLLIFFKNTGTSIIKSLKIILGVIFIAIGCLFSPEILNNDILTNIIIPIIFDYRNITDIR